MSNFKVVEVKGFTKQEALDKAPFETYFKDATQAWKKAGTPITDKALKEFCSNYLEKNTKFAPGVACTITVENGVASTRERPYTITDVKSEGPREYRMAQQLINPENDTIVATTKAKLVDKVDKEGNKVLDEDGKPVKVWKSPTKAEAKELAKSLYTDYDYQGDIVCRPYKQEVTGNDVLFTVKYTPSKSAKQGTYICFGVERD